jgi:hypothetical protein
MKFAQATKGTRAETPVDIPIPGTSETVPALLRPLTALEDMDVVARATDTARAKKVEPRDGESVYDAALWAETLAIAVLDKDSPAGARERFFEDAAQIVADYDTDTLAMLHEQQRLWQESCSPLLRAKSMGDLIATWEGLAGDNAERFFVGMSPRTRFLSMLTLVRHVWASPELRSLATSPTPSTSTESAKH